MRLFLRVPPLKIWKIEWYQGLKSRRKIPIQHSFCLVTDGYFCSSSVHPAFILCLPKPIGKRLRCNCFTVTSQVLPPGGRFRKGNDHGSYCKEPDVGHSRVGSREPGKVWIHYAGADSGFRGRDHRNFCFCNRHAKV